MKIIPSLIIVFLISAIVYYLVGTKYTLRPQWTTDYFNPLARSLQQFRLDLVDPGGTHDLILYAGKWYAPWGILAALFFVPLQIIKGGAYVPSIYIAVFFGSLNVCVSYLVLRQIQRDYFPKMSGISLVLFLFLFAFGTTHFYVTTLGSSWHVDQIVSTFFAFLGTFFLIRKNRQPYHYIVGAWIIALTLLGRATLMLTSLLPWILYIWDFVLPNLKDIDKLSRSIWKGLVWFLPPAVLFSVLFFLYNYIRFGSIFEYGYNYIHEAPNLAMIRQANGIMSFKNLPTNLWHMLFEIPSFYFKDGKVKFLINLAGNSILFLSPPLMAAFLAVPIEKIRKRFALWPIIFTLVVTVVVVMIPSLLIYSTGWMQFGYRYSLDITLLVLVLAVFGMRGNMSLVWALGTVFAVFVHFWGIQALF